MHFSQKHTIIILPQKFKCNSLNHKSINNNNNNNNNNGMCIIHKQLNILIFNCISPKTIIINNINQGLCGETSSGSRGSAPCSGLIDRSTSRGQGGNTLEKTKVDNKKKSSIRRIN